MEIVPFLGEERITSSKVEVRVNGSDRARALGLAEQARSITVVNDEESFTAGRRTAGQLKAMLDEIDLARKASKQPFSAVGTAIDELARDVAGPVKAQQDRILALLAGYVTKLEAQREADKRAVAETNRIAQEEADRKLREAQEARDKARAELRAARNEIERVKLKEAAARREAQLAQEKLAQELASEMIVEPEPERGLVPGGRVDHHYDFELVDVTETIRAGCWRLLKWTLDIRACQDSVRNLVEAAPNLEPELPGIKITKTLNVSVKAASRIK